MTIDDVLGLYNYWVVIFLMMTGFYIVIASTNLIKAIIGLNIFQTSVFLLYITMGKVDGGTAPIIPPQLADSHGGEHAANGHAAGGHATVGHVVDGHAVDGHVEAVAEHATEHAEQISTHAGDLAGHAGDLAGHTGDLAAHAGDVASEAILYSHPLPSVLMLTAIVVGIATTALALALIVRIREEYGTIEEDEILALDRRA